ncbi:hypothetical protein NRB56_08810 [Nocardia sp. RB56]|uniref:Uncharacterized protein n=1 Tax=Nocardia aurantia TaxID=2585199 RepID=A0A7K0DHP2_9NOCA|nr:hypothetical protein [Nocardia aurantia]
MPAVDDDVERIVAIGTIGVPGSTVGRAKSRIARPSGGMLPNPQAPGLGQAQGCETAGGQSRPAVPACAYSVSAAASDFGTRARSRVPPSS